MVASVLPAWFPWKDSFLIVPLAAMVGNVLIAGLLSLVRRPDPSLYDRALRMISLVSNASISIVTLTFSLTVLSIQVASQTYSPRLLDEFTKDPMSKIVISVNLGAYAFCYTINYFLTEETEPVPYVAVHLLSLHMALVLVAFVSFIHFFVQGFRIEQILARASQSSLSAALALNDQVQGGLDDDIEAQPKVPESAYKVMADDSGYVTRFNLDRLVSLTEKLDACVRYNHQIGEFVNEGVILCYIWDAKTRENKQSFEDRVIEHIDHNGDGHKVEVKLGFFAAQGINLSKKRSGDFDVTLGIQQLCDVAVRALSPGINDPHTAIQCMDVLSSLMAELAKMDLEVPNARDDDGNVRLCAPRRSFSYLLSMLEPIRRYGAGDLSVCRRGLRMFGDLAAILSRAKRLDRVPSVLTHLEQWMLVCKKSFDEKSPELESLHELYDHLLRNIAESDMIKKGKTEEKDLQDFEVTHKDSNSDPESMREKESASMSAANSILATIQSLIQDTPSSESSK